MFWLFFMVLLFGLVIVYPYILYCKFSDLTALDNFRIVDAKEAEYSKDAKDAYFEQDEEKVLIHPSE
jgi:hypothetical protein